MLSPLKVIILMVSQQGHFNKTSIVRHSNYISDLVYLQYKHWKGMVGRYDGKGWWEGVVGRGGGIRGW